MKPLPVTDFATLSAAEGWLMLRNVPEAFKELQRVSDSSLMHPATLSIFWKALFAAQRWDDAYQVAQKLADADPSVPFGSLCMAQSLAQQQRLSEAKALLLQADQIYRHNRLIPYNLACYCCRMGELDEARDWLVKALARGGSALLQVARIDPDLAALSPWLKKSGDAAPQQPAENSANSRFQWQLEG